jgi:hypothetical protein
MPHEKLLDSAMNKPLPKGIISYQVSDEDEGRRKYYWHPPGLPPILTLELLWPPQWDTHLTDFFVGETLPIESQLIIEEVKECVAKQIGRSEATSRLYINHALGREVFVCNTNRAVLRYICGSSKEHEEFDPERSSLHFYINTKSSAIFNAYKVAQAKLFGKAYLIEQGNFLIKHTPETACMLIKPRRFQVVFEFLLREIERTDISDPFKIHNNFVRYVALVLLLASGHRETRQLFHFAFTLNLTEAIAFLSDKQRIGSEARFIPLTTTAIHLIEA